MRSPWLDRLHKTSESEKTIVVDFADWGQTSMQPLHLTIDECGKIITDSLRDTPVPPEITDEIQQLQLPEHRSLALALWLFDRFRNNMDRAALAVQPRFSWKDENQPPATLPISAST